MTLAFLGTFSALAQNSQRPLSDIELKSFVNSLQSRIEDSTVEIVIRERLALDLAATFDRAAQNADNPATRRSLWDDAVSTLDQFRETHRGQDLSRSFEVQAAVYLWARARMEISAFRFDPADKESAKRAISDLEAAIARLKAVSIAAGKPEDIVSKNARFRLAQALADLAEMTTDDPKARESHYRDALNALEPPINEPSLVAFQRLLKASVLVRLNLLNEAGAVLDEVSKLKTPVVPLQFLEGRIEWLTANKKFAEASKLIEDTTAIDAGLKAYLQAHVHLSEWKSFSGPAPGRSTVESTLFKDLAVLRKAKRLEFRLAMLDVVSAIKEPDAKQDEVAWDILADGFVVSHNLGGAGELERKGAERASGLGKKQVANDLRLKAGAYFFQTGRTDEVEKSVAPILKDADAGPQRVKASLLLALALGRAVSEGGRGVTRSQYASALKNHLKAFPGDPTVSEVEWLLGKVSFEEGDRQGAIKLWSTIEHGQPRWLESKLELARLHKLDLDQQRLNGDREASDRRFKEAFDFLEGCLKQARGEPETNPIQIAIARLELTPTVGHPSDALKRIEIALHAVLTPEQRATVRWLRVVALAQLSRFVEAEQFVKRESKDSDPFLLLEPLRLLDRSAAESESDLRARRIAFLSAVLLDRLRTFNDIYTADQQAEISLRYARSFAFSGNEAAAKRALSTGRPLPRTSNPDLLRDLAELYSRLEVYGLAVDVQRLRAKQLTPGSIPWFDACYGLALAYYHEGKGKEALHLIDATSILHPELGGSELKTKFIRLRQRLEPAAGTN